MAISTTCTACGKRYQAPDHMAGRRVRCKDCGTTFQLPASESDESDPFRPEDDAALSMSSGSSESESDDGGGIGFAEREEEAEAPRPVRRSPATAPPSESAPFGDGPFDPNADLDAAFDEAFQEYTPSRGNTPFVFPGSRWLDRWLSTIIAGICVAWLAYITLSSTGTDPNWVGPVRLLILMLAYVGVVYPICLKGVRMAARKLNYDLPSGAAWRAYSTFLLPTTIGCALWLGSGSPPGFFLGAALGLIVALPVMWLLFRIRQDDAPTSLGYGAAALGSGLLAAVLILFLLNLIIYGVVKSTKAQHSLKTSPFGPGFTWDPAKDPVKPVKKTALPSARRGEPEKPTTKAFSELPPVPVTTQPSPADQAFVPKNATLPTDPAALKAIEEHQAVPEAPDASAQTPPAAIEKPEHGPIVTDVKPRIAAEMDSLVMPLLPGKAVAVVRTGQRNGEDRVEMWSTTEWAAKNGVSFAGEAQSADHYQLNADGTLLARLADFPQASAQVYSYEHNQLVRPFIKLDPKGPVPTLVGFCAPDQLLMMFKARGQLQPNIEVWDTNKIKRLKHIDVPGLRTDPRSRTISRDGKLMAVIAYEPESLGDTNGRIEIYNLSTGALVRKIVVDEMDWTTGAQPVGLSMTDEARKVAVLFERAGQGIFLCWGADNDIPIHQFIYPGGLLPVGVNGKGFKGSGFDLIDDGAAWLLFGSSVFDSASGRRLGDLGIPGIVSQKVVKRDTLMLLQGPTTTPNTVLLEVKLDVAKARREELAKP